MSIATKTIKHGKNVNSGSQLECIELFAGAGGLALGLSAAGVRHMQIVEWDHYACETIRQNIRRRVKTVRDWPDPYEGDVRDVSFAEFVEISIISGGVPCQPFSMGGKHRANLDPRDMFPQAIRAIREARPGAFVFENVRGLVRPAFENYFQYIRLQLEYPSVVLHPQEEWTEHLARLERHKTGGGKVESNVVYRVLDSANYGVPQRRHRVFIVGIRADRNREFSFPSPTHSHDRLLFDQYVTGEYWLRHGISKRLRSAPPPQYRQRIEALRSSVSELMLEPWQTVRDVTHDLPAPERNSRQSIQGHEYQPGARSYVGHTGSPLDEPAKALKAGDHGVPGGENMLRRADNSVRYFTVRESARIQCFPDEFEFAGSWSETMRQLGNAVPVRLANIVAARLVEVIGT